MSSAVVLGGGGPVGIAWEAGLLTGLRGAGMDLSGAGAIVGTSAGSVVGAALALGDDMSSLAEWAAIPLSLLPGKEVDLVLMQAAVTEAASAGRTPAAAMIAVGALAANSPTVDEATFVRGGMCSALAGRDWPVPLACTAIDIATGGFLVLDRHAGVGLDRATAASCAVPTVFPPVTSSTAG